METLVINMADSNMDTISQSPTEIEEILVSYSILFSIGLTFIHSNRIEISLNVFDFQEKECMDLEQDTMTTGDNMHHINMVVVMMEEIATTNGCCLFALWCYCSLATKFN